MTGWVTFYNLHYSILQILLFPELVRKFWLQTFVLTEGSNSRTNVSVHKVVPIHLTDKATHGVPLVYVLPWSSPIYLLTQTLSHMLWTNVIIKVNFVAEVMGVQVPGWIAKHNSTVQLQYSLYSFFY